MSCFLANYKTHLYFNRSYLIVPIGSSNYFLIMYIWSHNNVQHTYTTRTHTHARPYTCRSGSSSGADWTQAPLLPLRQGSSLEPHHNVLGRRQGKEEKENEEEATPARLMGCIRPWHKPEKKLVFYCPHCVGNAQYHWTCTHVYPQQPKNKY